MNGELAQCIAIVAHGNYILRKGISAYPELSINNSTFKYVSSVAFARYRDENQRRGTRVASTVTDWFKYLHSVGVKRLWIIAFKWERQDISEHKASAFVGGAARAIQSDLPKGFEVWYPAWKAGGTPDKPWSVEYRGLKFAHSHAITVRDLAGIKMKLRKAITRAEGFAKSPKTKAADWAESFARALKLLDSPAPVPPVQADMLPAEGYSLEARQVLAAATQAHVFGAMGSWNDMGFRDDKIQREYESVSSELYEAIKLATVMAPNAFHLGG